MKVKRQYLLSSRQCTISKMEANTPMQPHIYLCTQRKKNVSQSSIHRNSYLYFFSLYHSPFHNHSFPHLIGDISSQLLGLMLFCFGEALFQLLKKTGAYSISFLITFLAFSNFSEMKEQMKLIFLNQSLLKSSMISIMAFLVIKPSVLVHLSKLFSICLLVPSVLTVVLTCFCQSHLRFVGN